MVNRTIFKEGNDDTFEPGIFLAMTHIKNLRSTQELKGFIHFIKI